MPALLLSSCSLPDTCRLHPWCVLQLRVAHMSEWDDAAYLSRHPNVSTAVTSKKYIDGLHHFLADGFNKGLASCWNDTRVPSGRAFCIQ